MSGGAIIGLFAIVLILLFMNNHSRNKRAEKEYQKYVEQRGRVVGSHRVKCPECGKGAILKVYESDDEVVQCVGCGYEETR